MFDLNTLTGCSSNVHSLFFYIYFFFMCQCLSVCLMCVEPVKDKRGGKSPRELEFQEVVTPGWMMRTECWYPERAESTLPH